MIKNKQEEREDRPLKDNNSNNYIMVEEKNQNNIHKF